MGAHDGQSPTQLVGSAPHSRSSSRPGSSHNKPWTEARSSSPASARSPLTSPVKPLPFVRPADIYRRMEEEKEKERRRSMESGGRPSLDGARSNSRTGDHAEAIASPKSQPALQAQTTSFDQKPTEELPDTHSGRNLRPGLATVAERKSEYGLEGLIDSYGSDDTAAEPEPAASALAKQTPSEPEPVKDLRRYSTSPKLPELGRMSMFGDDFFSTSSNLSSGPPPLPRKKQPLPESSRPSATPGIPARGVHDSGNAVQAENVTTQSAQPINEISTRSPPKDEPNPTVEPTDKAQPDVRSLQQQALATEPAQRPAASTDIKQPTRPSLPGGWVTETLETPNEGPGTPGSVSPQVTSPTGDGKVSRLTQQFENMDELKEKLEGPSRPASGPTSPGANGVVFPPPGRPKSSSKNQQFELPPLRTGSPPHSAPVQAAPQQNVSQEDPRVDLPPSDSEEAASPGSDVENGIPTGGSTHDTEITPTAPLNPSRSAQHITVGDVIPPLPSFGAGSTLDTSSSSPVKESDMLREEIIKSLSPLGPSGDCLEVKGDVDARHAAATTSPVRESSYLGDVYGDYWATSEDKRISTHLDSQPEAQKVVEDPPNASQVPVSVLPTIIDEKSLADLRRRFSWEAESKTSDTQAPTSCPTAEEKQAATEQTSKALVGEQASTSPTGSPSITLTRIEATGLSAQTAGGISHQVSDASTLQARSTDGPIEPPSPISVQLEKNGSSDHNGRSSFAEDKVLLQPSAAPLPLSLLPSDVVAEPSDLHRPLSEEAPSQAEPSSPTAQNLLSILTFRQIMDLPQPSERLKAYNETRGQFAAIDTGLNDWMSAVLSQHPEHAAAANQDDVDSQQAGHVLSQAHGHASFFHHHNTSTAGFGHTGRTAANIPMPPTPPHGSSLGHSGTQVAQVGAKSKKLLMAAGKAGKGLLNKGKHKLSGTGEKAFFNS